MKEKDKAELEAVKLQMERIKAEQPGIEREELLNTAIEAAGIDLGMTSIDQCDNCNELYNTEYGGEYVDGSGLGDNSDLAEDLYVDVEWLSKTLAYKHYCDFRCCQEAVREARTK